MSARHQLEKSERMPQISVIVPVFKVEPYLHRCIDSILNQTFPDFELILVDDGSPDNCGSICDEYAEKDKRVHVIHQENQGVSSARNAGLRAARGAWISFVDSDDWAHSQFFEMLLSLIQDSSPQVLASNHIRTAEWEEEQHYSQNEIEVKRVPFASAIDKWNDRFTVWGKLYSQRILKGEFFDEDVPYGEDALFNLKVFSRLESDIPYVEQKLYYYFDREDSCVNHNRSEKRADLCKTYIEYAEKEQNHKLRTAYLTSAIKRLLSTRYQALIENEDPKIVRDCNTYLEIALKRLRSDRGCSPKMLFRYTVLFWSPALYRLWRMKNDPTMLIWEKGSHLSCLESTGVE